MNAYLERYLTAVGFDVVFATRVDVDIHDDTAILRWARRRRRIMVCHDKFRDGQTRVKLFSEIYENGGRIIRIGGKPDQPPLTSLGKIIVHRRDWLDFFSENDGVVVVHMTGMNKMPKENLLRRIRQVTVDTTDALRRPRRQHPGTHRHKPPPAEQIEMTLDEDA